MPITTRAVNRIFTRLFHNAVMDEHLVPLGDDDIFRLADLMLLRHGLDAAAIAAQRAKWRFGQGDMDGYRAWMRIVLVVDDLFAMGPPDSASVH